MHPPFFYESPEENERKGKFEPRSMTRDQEKAIAESRAPVRLFCSSETEKKTVGVVFIIALCLFLNIRVSSVVLLRSKFLTSPKREREAVMS